MAYDPNDPKDKEIVQGLIDEALEEQRETHENEIEGLKSKNKQLIGKLNKARAGDNIDTGEVERLENELAETQGKLRTAETELRRVNRDLESVTGERDTAVSERDSEREQSRREFVNNRLTSELTAANVAPHFLDDLVASLGGQVEVKDDNGERKAFVGDKPLGEFIKEWSQGDKGKHYVKAPANGGGGANNSNNNPQGGDKKIWQMNTQERADAHRADPAGFEARIKAGEHIKPADA